MVSQTPTSQIHILQFGHCFDITSNPYWVKSLENVPSLKISQSKENKPLDLLENSGILLPMCKLTGLVCLCVG